MRDCSSSMYAHFFSENPGLREDDEAAAHAVFLAVFVHTGDVDEGCFEAVVTPNVEIVRTGVHDHDVGSVQCGDGRHDLRAELVARGASKRNVVRLHAGSCRQRYRTKNA